MSWWWPRRESLVRHTVVSERLPVEFVVSVDELRIGLFSALSAEHDSFRDAFFSWRFRKQSRLRRQPSVRKEVVYYDRKPSCLAPPPWRLGFTNQFCKDVTQLDRKLQGHILEALRKLSALAWPFNPQGDTFKPLSGGLKGQWRYRIGDYRLVVRLIVEESELALVTFAARGSVYD